MPTMRYGKVRRLLKSKQAKVVKRCPFTIQLMYESTTHTQVVSLGIDAGSKTIGVSATTEATVLYEAEVTLRNDIVELLSTRRQNRRTRRNRKTRYRQARFDNRTHSKHQGCVDNRDRRQFFLLLRISRPVECRCDAGGCQKDKKKFHGRFSLCENVDVDNH